MREVDQADDAVHHRIAQRDQRIHAAQRQAIDYLLSENIHTRVRSSRGRRSDAAIGNATPLAARGARRRRGCGKWRRSAPGSPRRRHRPISWPGSPWFQPFPTCHS
ncbi:Uncharacterised protein [Bordetella pertussis]|nr:Uncharacterised protein [Bordetella pertussis]